MCAVAAAPAVLRCSCGATAHDSARTWDSGWRRCDNCGEDLCPECAERKFIDDCCGICAKHKEEERDACNQY